MALKLTLVGLKEAPQSPLIMLGNCLKSVKYALINSNAESIKCSNKYLKINTVQV